MCSIDANMQWGTTSRGTDMCPNFATLATFKNTMLVVSAALSGDYCALNHKRNGFAVSANRLPVIQ